MRQWPCVCGEFVVIFFFTSFSFFFFFFVTVGVLRSVASAHFSPESTQRGLPESCEVKSWTMVRWRD